MSYIRLDQWVAKATGLSRSVAKKLIQQQRIQINQHDGLKTCLTDAKYKLATNAHVLFDNQTISLQNQRYILLNKPAGYICSSYDEAHPSALNLLTSINDQSKLHFAGRLDVDTTGLVLISNDGQWTHKVTSPRKKCTKTYRVTCAETVDSSQIEHLEKGILLKSDDKPTLPAKVEKLSDKKINLTISEGRYHQVKRMLAAVGNHVEQLHRAAIGELDLAGLAEGEWRELSLSEIEFFN